MVQKGISPIDPHRNLKLLQLLGKVSTLVATAKVSLKYYNVVNLLTVIVLLILSVRWVVAVPLANNNDS